MISPEKDLGVYIHHAVLKIQTDRRVQPDSKTDSSNEGQNSGKVELDNKCNIPYFLYSLSTLCVTRYALWIANIDRRSNEIFYLFEIPSCYGNIVRLSDLFFRSGPRE